MKLFPKIIGIGVVGLLAAITIGGVATYTGQWINGIQDEEYKYRSFRAQIMEARLAHMNWLKNISETIIAKKPELSVVTDGKACIFGKWYYSEEAKKAVKTKSENLQKMFQDIEPGHLEVHQLGGQFMDLWNKGNHEPAIELFNEKISPLATTLLKDMEDMAAFSLTEIEEIHAASQWILDNQALPTIVVLLIGVLVLLPYSWLTARGIVKPMQTGGEILRGIAEAGRIQTDMPEDMLRRQDEIGDLSRGVKQILEDYRAIAKVTEDLAAGNWQFTVQTKSSDDVMNQSFNEMLNQVNAALHKISTGVAQVATGSGEVSNASQSLSDGAQQAAASLEEITASMSEISSQTRANAESAGQARDLAQKASQAAATGQEAMQEMTGAMGRITQNSSEIQRVIKVIDDIAFQTNLLALNAAVEAARAGQHGKGFAVVAEEVRNLASRSAKAAQETSELIAKSGQEIEKGDKIATHTAEVLNTIVEQIKETTNIVAGIAIASNEQAEGVNQVTIGLQQIDAVTQQNTASAEESASAAGEMSSMAANLQNLVGQFKLR